MADVYEDGVKVVQKHYRALVRDEEKLREDVNTVALADALKRARKEIAVAVDPSGFSQGGGGA